MPGTEAILSNIKKHFAREEFNAKALLVSEGAVARKVFFIEKGLARVWFWHEEKEITFQFLLEGQFISSFESLLSHTPSWYSIEALEPMVTYSCTDDEFRQKMETLPHVKEFYYHYVQQRLLF